jgi:hypothetical protein
LEWELGHLNAKETSKNCVFLRGIGPGFGSFYALNATMEGLAIADF